MTLTIDFSPVEEEHLTAAARQEGLEPAALVKRLVNQQLPLTAPEPQDPMLALFAQWDREDAQMTPAEVAQENRSWEDLKTNIDAERDRAGARRVF